MGKNKYLEEVGLQTTGQKKNKVVYVGELEDLVDIVKTGNTSQFLFSTGETLDYLEKDGVEYNPPSQDMVAWEIPTLEAVLSEVSEVTDVSDVSEEGGRNLSRNLSKLFNDLLEYHKETAELPEEYLYLIITAWDFHTHMLEWANYSPVICFTGLPEKGKTRMARSMTYVARRGVTKVSVSDAQLIREAKDHGITIFFDMQDFLKSVKDAGTEDVMLNRYERGARVSRVLYPERGPFQDMVYYEVFGPTIVASNENLDQIFETRSVNITMQQSSRQFKSGVNKKKGEKLRNKLIAWRMVTLGKPAPEVEKLVPGRLGDIMLPLHQIVLAVAPEYEEQFKDAVNRIAASRAEAKADTFESELLFAILESKNMVYGGTLPVKVIEQNLNKDRSDSEKINSKRIGRKLKIMGFKKTRMGSTGSSYIEWNNQLNESLALEYGLIDAANDGVLPIITSVISETSVNSGDLATNNDYRPKDIDLSETSETSVGFNPENNIKEDQTASNDINTLFEEAQKLFNS